MEWIAFVKKENVRKAEETLKGVRISPEAIYFRGYT